MGGSSRSAAPRRRRVWAHAAAMTLVAAAALAPTPWTAVSGALVPVDDGRVAAVAVARYPNASAVEAAAAWAHRHAWVGAAHARFHRWRDDPQLAAARRRDADSADRAAAAGADAAAVGAEARREGAQLGWRAPAGTVGSSSGLAVALAAADTARRADGGAPVGCGADVAATGAVSAGGLVLGVDDVPAKVRAAARADVDVVAVAVEDAPAAAAALAGGGDAPRLVAAGTVDEAVAGVDAAGCER